MKFTQNTFNSRRIREAGTAIHSWKSGMDVNPASYRPSRRIHSSDERHSLRRTARRISDGLLSPSLRYEYWLEGTSCDKSATKQVLNVGTELFDRHQ